MSGGYVSQCRPWATRCILSALLHKSAPDELIHQQPAVRVLLRDHTDVSFNV